MAHLRPSLPQQQHLLSQMVLSASAPAAEVYAATCNPPRKAKRPRVDVNLDDNATGTAAGTAATARTTSSSHRTQPLAPRPPAPQQPLAPHNVRIRPAPAPPTVPSAHKDQPHAIRGSAHHHHPAKNNSSGTLVHQSSAHVGSTSASTSPHTMSPTTHTDPSPSSAAPKKRGRKPGGALSRSARESQRKINHSRIEKARRSKINDALDALRRLVPSDYGKGRGGVDGSANGDGESLERRF